MKQEKKSTLIYISNKYFSTLSTFIQNGIVENFNNMSLELRQCTEHTMNYIDNIIASVTEGSKGINVAADNTANLSDEITNISEQIKQNKIVADTLSSEAKRFV